MPKEALATFGERWNKKVKGQIAMRGEEDLLDPPPVPTGLELVDKLLGGGFARGRTSMLYGAESAGKTLLCQLLIAKLQGDGGRALYVDAEHAFSPSWFKLTGVDLDPEKLLVVRPWSLEQAFDVMCEAIKDEVVDLVVVDSLPALVPATIMMAAMEERDFQGLFPRKLTMGVAKVTQMNHRVAFVVINQMRVNMHASQWEPTETYPGGKSLRHNCSMVMRVRRGGWITEGGEKTGRRIGYTMRVRTEKNKLAPPWQETEIRVYFNGEVDDLAAVLGTLINQGVIVAKSGYYRVPGVEEVLHGWTALDARVRGDPELRDALFNSVSVSETPDDEIAKVSEKELGVPEFPSLD